MDSFLGSKVNSLYSLIFLGASKFSGAYVPLLKGQGHPREKPQPKTTKNRSSNPVPKPLAEPAPKEDIQSGQVRGMFRGRVRGGSAWGVEGMRFCSSLVLLKRTF